jgi:hypothetical protein
MQPKQKEQVIREGQAFSSGREENGKFDDER